MRNLKQKFMLDPSIIFLNHGSYGATPKIVFREYQHWQSEMERRPVEFLGRKIANLLADARAVLGKYLGTHGDNLVYVQNVTIALNVVARSMQLKPGDEVLSTAYEYGAMDRTWRFLSGKIGFRYLNQQIDPPLTSPEKFLEDFWRGVTENTRIIFISHMTSSTAIIFPIKPILDRAREAGILTIVDGAHVPGQLPLNLDTLGADFYGGNLHKWLCAPKGAGFLYANPRVQNLIEPLVVSWGYESENPGPSNFIDRNEWWGTRDHAAFLAVPAAIEFQRENDWDEVRDACHQLALYAQERIGDLTGLSPLHPLTRGWFCQMTAIPLPSSVNPIELQEKLFGDYNIEVPVHEWNGNNLIRVSVQGYNTKRDIDLLIKAISELL